MIIQKYRVVTIALTTRLSFTFSWLMKGAQWAIGIVRAAQGHERGGSLRCSRGLLLYAHKSQMAAWFTWRGIPITQHLQPVFQRANQPLVP